MTDPIALAQALIRRPSVTPQDEGAIGVLEDALKPLGFACHRLRFEAEGTPPIENLYARLGTSGPNFCFAGHTDVVPPGDAKRWRCDPFAAEVKDGVLYGRGATDMKGAIAAFVAAVSRVAGAKRDLPGSISLLITGDEEGPAINGTIKVLGWLEDHGEKLDHCLVGEPSSAARTGDVIKIGRRGSMNFKLQIAGTQGHVAYPVQALNPIPILAELVTRLSTQPLDKGSDHFEASTLSFTSVDVGNPATNVIPGEARAAFNIRFNDLHTPDSLLRHVQSIAKEVTRDRGGEILVSHEVSGVSFVTQPGRFTDLLREAVEAATGIAPEFSTGGGTSDARFIKDHCPVAELGLPSRTMHKCDECVVLEDLAALTRIYETVLTLYFGESAVIDAAYLRHALATALRMARFDRTAIGDFDQSYEGFFRSFTAILLCAPIYVLTLIAERHLATDPSSELAGFTLARLPPPSFALYTLEALTYVVSWLVFPVAMILMVRLLGVTQRYVPLIVAYNWTSCIILFATALPWLLYLTGIASVGGIALLFGLVWIFALVYRWVVARDGLQTSGLTAAGIAIFDWLLGLIVLMAAARLRASL